MGNWQNFIKTRLLQSWRFIRAAGWITLIALPLVFIFYLSFLDRLKSASPLEIAGISLLIPLTLHFGRKDRKFLKKHGYSLPLLFTMEYLMLGSLITMPVIALYGQLLALPFLAIGSFLLALLPALSSKIKGQHPWQLPFIPLTAFEFRAGFRQYGWLLLLINLLGLIASKWVAPPLIAILISTSLLPNIYNYCEPKEWMENRMLQAGNLIKVSLLHIGIWLLFLSPLGIAFLIFSNEYWYLLLVSILISVFYLLFAIFYKYANYWPGRNKLHTGLVSAFMWIGLSIPFTAPICIIYVILLYRKAKIRLAFFKTL